MHGAITVGLDEPRTARGCGVGAIELSVERDTGRSRLIKETDDVGMSCVGGSAHDQATSSGRWRRTRSQRFWGGGP